jgi:hypothetical protein
MKTLIWSVAWGEYRYMLQTLMDSIRSCGLQHDILTFSDEPLANVTSCEVDKSIQMDFKQYWKFHYLNKIRELDYDLFVFIDSDHYFVRKPPKEFHEIIGPDPWHSFLESPINSELTKRPDWWGVTNSSMTKIYRDFGVTQDTVYSTNGGFWMCRKEFMKQAANVGFLFRDYQKGLGLDLPEEVAIAVISHMFSADYSQRFHKRYMDIWASEWTGVLQDRLPDGSQWEFQEYMTGTKSLLNPAIVHAMRSKNALVGAGKSTFEKTKSTRKFISWDKVRSGARWSVFDEG